MANNKVELSDGTVVMDITDTTATESDVLSGKTFYKANGVRSTGTANEYTTAEKTKLAGIAEGAEVNVQADWEEDDTTADAYIQNKPTLGTAAAKDYTDHVQPGSHALVESNAVYSAINNAMSSVYTPRGDLTCAELTSSLLVAANVGSVYEMSDSGTTSALFLQGAGQTISVGDNVGVIQVGENTYKFNLMAGAFDLSDYQKKDLTTPITVDGTPRSTVEAALGALNTAKQNKTLDTPVSVAGESKTTVEAALAALAALPISSILASPRMHANIYRGQYLGSSVTAEQYAAISAGTFDGLYVGDYWTIGGVNWRIADFDYWYNKGDTACSTHHVVIVPDTNLTSAKMNNTNTTGSDPGGYIGSDFKTGANSNTGLATATTAINNAFGSAHILSKRLLFTNKVANGIATGGNWYDSTIDLMNEINVYGSYIFTPAPNGTTIPYNYTTDTQQFALFRLEPARICNRAYWWLRDVVSAATFAIVYHGGNAHATGASYSLGVRPAFAIKA